MSKIIAIGPYNISSRRNFTLTFIALKPGLIMAHGRDRAGEIWLDTLDIDCSDPTALEPANPAVSLKPCALLNARQYRYPLYQPHDSHKGMAGDVMLIGGQPGMEGALMLAAVASLHAGAGRVMACWIGSKGPTPHAASHPEIMQLPLEKVDVRFATVVCGCGAGNTLSDVMPNVLNNAPRLVLDADALNALAGQQQIWQTIKTRAKRQQHTILTPHPLEAARLLGCQTIDVQRDRITAATALAEQFDCTVVLKGSGTIIASPSQTPVINFTGNGRLATGGTGDVLAGMMGGRWASSFDNTHALACRVTLEHGLIADQWPVEAPTLTAHALATAIKTG
jgi:ADP-dependent NAD(P)H-hydrate dehydratase / NAD(P)H-hydrate epimerase